MASVTSISGTLISHVKILFFNALKESLNKNSVRYGINQYYNFSLSAYSLSVAAIEAFLFENFLGEYSPLYVQNEEAKKVPRKMILSAKLKEKVEFVSKFFAGSCLDTSREPFQSVKSLISIRNDLVHFKMDHKDASYIKNLSAKKILFPSDDNPVKDHWSWTDKLSCSEGIRWAHNSACDLIKLLSNNTESTQDEVVERVRLMAENFKKIEHVDVKKWYEKNRIDISKNYPLHLI